MFTLPSNMRINGLQRKSKIGTRFTITDSFQEHPPLGYSTLFKRSKDGTHEAVLDTTGEHFTFHTDDKIVWPNVKPAKKL